MNWGNRLLIVFIVFGAGISYLVYRSMHVNFELVNADYYKEELKYQEVIDGAARASALSTPVRFNQTNQELSMQMPEEMKSGKLSGHVLFYCAYNEKLDRNFDLQTNDGGAQVFEKGKIAPGSYTVKVDWQSDGKNYHSETIIKVI